jgi:hypothetical protein
MTHLSPTTNLRREPNSGAPPTERTNVDRHNSQFIRKLACDFINSNPYRYALTRDGRLVEIQDSKLTAAVQTDLPGSSQTPPDELKTAAQAGHRQRVPRRPSIGKMIAQAEKATGKPITSVTLPDGTKLDFGKHESAEPENPWLAGLSEATKQ